MESKTNTGKPYEIFVAIIMQAILNSEKHSTQKNIKVEQNKKLIGKSGIEREFDIYWEYEQGGITYKTIIECKDWNANISVEKLDALQGKLKDFPDIKGVFATTKGYQSGFIKKADSNKIDCLIIREQNDQDWQDKDGNPYLKNLLVDIEVVMNRAEIIDFNYYLNEECLKENTRESLRIEAQDDQIIIEDLDNNEKYSLLELSKNLFNKHKDSYGNFFEEKMFENAFIYCQNNKVKLEGYKIKYRINKPGKESFKIDYSNELLGVIEYLSKGKKTKIFKKGTVKNELL